MSVLTALAELLEELDVQGYTLHATSPSYYTSRNPDSPSGKRPNLRLVIIGRTDFEKVATVLEAKVTERVVNVGQRAWWAECDTDTRKLLIEGVSFQHHDDWEPRP